MMKTLSPFNELIRTECREKIFYLLLIIVVDKYLNTSQPPSVHDKVCLAHESFIFGEDGWSCRVFS